jgi:hypothetical protein
LLDDDAERQVALVPVSKIISLTDGRGQFGASWWDHISLKAGSLVRSRLEYLLERLCKLGLQDFRNSFQEEKYQVSMYHFVEHNCFAVVNDGNHRTTLAKVMNASYMSSRIIECHIKPKKYDDFVEIEQLKNELLVQANNYNLLFDGNNILYQDQVVFPVHIPSHYWHDFDSARKELEYYITLLKYVADLNQELCSFTWFMKELILKKWKYSSSNIRIENHSRRILLKLYSLNWCL